MNDRVLNEKESLELIAQMIQNTKSRMTRNSGAPFLIWGYTTIIVSLLVWFLLKETGNYHWGPGTKKAILKSEGVLAN
jgi:hypothetical protein